MAYDEVKLRANIASALDEFMNRALLMPETDTLVVDAVTDYALATLKLICGDSDSPVKPRGLLRAPKARKP